MIQKMPNLFYFVFPQLKHQSFLSVFTTYVLLPLAITMGVLGSGIVMPNGLEAALALFFAVAICSVLLAVGLSFLKWYLTGKAQAVLYVLSSVFAPFLIWYGYTLTI